jgi:hypothetical protein
MGHGAEDRTQGLLHTKHKLYNLPIKCHQDPKFFSFLYSDSHSVP